MRRIATTLMATCLLFFVACSDEGDVVTIYNGDSFTSDYKASQMFSTLSLYENIARQPEMVTELMRATAKLAQYDTITAIAPLDKEAEVERGTARGKCLAACFSSIARQPEAYDDIVWAAEKFLGTTEIKSMSEKILKYSRLYALEGVTEAVARQPEIVDLFDSFSVKFLGVGIK